MRWFNKLERQYGQIAVPNLTLTLIIGQIAAFFMIQAGVIDRADMVFVPSFVARGEIWRIASFLFLPPSTHPIFMAFAWYIFYIMGSALESHWGDFRYNVYVLIAWAASIAGSLLAGWAALLAGGQAYDMPATNAYIAGSVFLAFAWLNPEFVLHLFFVLPVKIKWLAWLTWAGYLFVFVTGPLLDKALVVAAVINFLLFFGREVYEMAWLNRRAMSQRARQFRPREEAEPFHTCTVCGKTDQSHPEMQFYYCEECAGAPGYCAEHIEDHEHLR